MAKNKIDEKNLSSKLGDTTLYEMAIKIYDNSFYDTNSNKAVGLYAVFDKMHDHQQDTESNKIERKAVNALDARSATKTDYENAYKADYDLYARVWLAVHFKCVQHGMWCKFKLGAEVDVDSSRSSLKLNSGENIDSNINSLFLLHDKALNEAYLTLKATFVRALEMCIEDSETSEKCYLILNFYKQFSARAHLEANKAVHRKHSLYDKYTDIKSFTNKLVLFNSQTGLSVPVTKWLDASSNNIIFTLQMKRDKFMQSKRIKNMHAGSAFGDIESIGFASDWSTVRSSIPYVECMKSDQMMEKIKAGDHNQANYRLRKHLNTGDRQFLLCIKERHGLKLVVFLSETLFMKLAVMKHNNHPSQIFALDTYIYEHERFDHPLENSIECTSRGNQIVLIAYDVETMSLDDTEPEFTTKDHLQKILGVDDHGIMLHQIYDTVKSDKGYKEKYDALVAALTKDLADANQTKSNALTAALGGNATQIKGGKQVFLPTVNNLVPPSVFG